MAANTLKTVTGVNIDENGLVFTLEDGAEIYVVGAEQKYKVRSTSDVGDISIFQLNEEKPEEITISEPLLLLFIDLDDDLQTENATYQVIVGNGRLAMLEKLLGEKEGYEIQPFEVDFIPEDRQKDDVYILKQAYGSNAVSLTKPIDNILAIQNLHDAYVTSQTCTEQDAVNYTANYFNVTDKTVIDAIAVAVNVFLFPELQPLLNDQIVSVNQFQAIVRRIESIRVQYPDFNFPEKEFARLLKNQAYSHATDAISSDPAAKLGKLAVTKAMIEDVFADLTESLENLENDGDSDSAKSLDKSAKSAEKTENAARKDLATVVKALSLPELAAKLESERSALIPRLNSLIDFLPEADREGIGMELITLNEKIASAPSTLADVSNMRKALTSVMNVALKLDAIATQISEISTNTIGYFDKLEAAKLEKKQAAAAKKVATGVAMDAMAASAATATA